VLATLQHWAYLVNDEVTGSGMSSSSSSQEIGSGGDDNDQERINPPGSEGKHFSIVSVSGH